MWVSSGAQSKAPMEIAKVKSLRKFIAQESAYPLDGLLIIRISQAIGIAIHDIADQGVVRCCTSWLRIFYYVLLYVLYCVVFIVNMWQTLNLIMMDTRHIFNVMLTSAVKFMVSGCQVYILSYFLWRKTNRRIIALWTNLKSYKLLTKEKSPAILHVTSAVSIMFVILRLSFIFGLHISNCLQHPEDEHHEEEEEGGGDHKEDHCINVPMIAPNASMVIGTFIVLIECIKYMIPTFGVLLLALSVRQLQAVYRRINKQFRMVPTNSQIEMLLKEYLGAKRCLDDLNEVFGPLIIAIMASHLISILGDLYRLLQHQDVDHIVDLSVSLYTVLLTCFVGTSFENEIHESESDFEEIMYRSDVSQDIKLQVLSLQMNMSHNNQLISGRGYFDMNKTFFVSVVLGLMTYSAIVLQFILAENTPAAETGASSEHGHD